ncbi:MAG: RdgB/HAM1 family non-canonical purine NTP pyrophosphatase [Holdemanella sp.]|nr:RdgB/HAM1 family non-canonical purine NTP pyrophosphatase [Holdemanella sp.]
MKTVWIASGNLHKVEEFQRMLKNVEVKCLKDLDKDIEIIENGKTFEENAIIKAMSLYNVIHQPVFSDDSGIEVDAMDKKPGVHSARWMGEDTSYDIKNQAIMDAVEGKDRTARYVCVIAFIDEEGNPYTYRATVEGEIYDRPLGNKGFGFDPIFYYPPFGTTLANVSEDMKNSISHRGKALEMFLAEWGDKL